LSASVNLISLFFPISTLNRETVITFAKPGPEDLASLVPCFYTEDSEIRLAALTVLPVEVLCVAETEDVDYRQ
jgi:hypothetical protein